MISFQLSIDKEFKMKANNDIRQAAKESHVYLYEIAIELLYASLPYYLLSQ